MPMAAKADAMAREYFSFMGCLGLGVGVGIAGINAQNTRCDFIETPKERLSIQNVDFFNACRKSLMMSCLRTFGDMRA